MPSAKLRTLQGQVLLIAALFAVCIVAASVMACQRPFFEQFVTERYQPLPEDIRPLAEAAATGGIDQEAFTRLSTTQRLALYDDWMIRAEPPPAETPRTLVAADPPLYLARAERSLVTGRMDQKIRALEFLRMSGSKDALPILRKAEHWAMRQRMLELYAHIQVTIAGIEGPTQAGESVQQR